MWYKYRIILEIYVVYTFAVFHKLMTFTRINKYMMSLWDVKLYSVWTGK